jgi:hypothetical protein
VKLITLAAAITGYDGVTVPMLRAWIKRGKLPATKAGKSYLVDPVDLAGLLRPTLRTPASRPARESEAARTERQLRQAGIA